MTILHDAGVDQGGFGAAEGASQQLTVLREAAGFDAMILQDAGRGFYRTEVMILAQASGLLSEQHGSSAGLP